MDGIVQSVFLQWINAPAAGRAKEFRDGSVRLSRIAVHQALMRWQS